MLRDFVSRDIVQTECSCFIQKWKWEKLLLCPFILLLSSSPAPEIHRPWPPQSSLPERDREWLVREGKPTSDSLPNWHQWVCAVIPVTCRDWARISCLWRRRVPEVIDSPLQDRFYACENVKVKALHRRLNHVVSTKPDNTLLSFSLILSPSISLSVSPPLPTHSLHSWILIRPLHPCVPWLGMSVCTRLHFLFIWLLHDLHALCLGLPGPPHLMLNGFVWA